jgi:phage shock protein A
MPRHELDAWRDQQARVIENLWMAVRGEHQELVAELADLRKQNKQLVDQLNRLAAAVKRAETVATVYRNGGL